MKKRRILHRISTKPGKSIRMFFNIIKKIVKRKEINWLFKFSLALEKNKCKDNQREEKMDAH